MSRNWEQKQAVVRPQGSLNLLERRGYDSDVDLPVEYLCPRQTKPLIYLRRRNDDIRWAESQRLQDWRLAHLHGWLWSRLWTNVHHQYTCCLLLDRVMKLNWTRVTKSVIRLWKFTKRYAWCDVWLAISLWPLIQILFRGNPYLKVSVYALFKLGVDVCKISHQLPHGL